MVDKLSADVVTCWLCVQAQEWYAESGFDDDKQWQERWAVTVGDDGACKTKAKFSLFLLKAVGNLLGGACDRSSMKLAGRTAYVGRVVVVWTWALVPRCDRQAPHAAVYIGGQTVCKPAWSDRMVANNDRCLTRAIALLLDQIALVSMAG